MEFIKYCDEIKKNAIIQSIDDIKLLYSVPIGSIIFIETEKDTKYFKDQRFNIVNLTNKHINSKINVIIMFDKYIKLKNGFYYPMIFDLLKKIPNTNNIYFLLTDDFYKKANEFVINDKKEDNYYDYDNILSFVGRINFDIHPSIHKQQFKLNMNALLKNKLNNKNIITKMIEEYYYVIAFIFIYYPADKKIILTFGKDNQFINFLNDKYIKIN